MDFIYGVRCILDTYKTAKCITNMFIDQTADLMESIGKHEFKLAINCLRDAKYSNREITEVDRSITILLSAISKIKDKNKLKFQGLLLVALCYNALGDIFNSNKYRDLSIYTFSQWLTDNRPSGMIGVPQIPGLSALRNYNSYIYFKQEVQSIGLNWEGHPLIGGLMTANWYLLNQEVERGVENAYIEYSRLVNRLF